MNEVLAHKVAVITGASGAIGRALACEFAAAGARVVLHCFRHRQPAEDTAAAIRDRGGQARVFQGALTSSAEARSLMQCAVDAFARLDILVNNAGISKDALLLLQAEQDWRTVMETNLFSASLCCREALRFMLRRRSGCMVNISSVSGLIGLPGQSAYAASKAGLIGLTKALAHEVGVKGIRVNAIAPGLIESAWVRQLPEARRETAAIALGRLGRPDEVARAAVFLASDWASYITGTVLNVSGGLYTGH
jgi:3-oxoacyl-[acyl-carrier protein] reductase